MQFLSHNPVPILVRCTACRFTWPYRNKKLHSSSSRPSQLFVPNRHRQQIDLEIVGIVVVSASLARPLTFAWSRSVKKPATGPSDASGEGQTFLCAWISTTTQGRKMASERRQKYQQRKNQNITTTNHAPRGPRTLLPTYNDDKTKYGDDGDDQVIRPGAEHVVGGVGGNHRIDDQRRISSNMARNFALNSTTYNNGDEATGGSSFTRNWLPILIGTRSAFYTGRHGSEGVVWLLLSAERVVRQASQHVYEVSAGAWISTNCSTAVGPETTTSAKS